MPGEIGALKWRRTEPPWPRAPGAAFGAGSKLGSAVTSMVRVGQGWSAARPGAHVGSALRDGENEPLLSQDSNGPADGVAADVVFLGERGLRRERVQPGQLA